MLYEVITLTLESVDEMEQEKGWLCVLGGQLIPDYGFDFPGKCSQASTFTVASSGLEYRKTKCVAIAKLGRYPRPKQSMFLEAGWRQFCLDDQLVAIHRLEDSSRA